MFLVILALLQPAFATPVARTLDVNFEDADVHAALRFLAEAGDVNIVVSDDVKGLVNLRLNRVTWDEAFFALLGQKGLVAVQVETTYEVRPRQGP